MKIKTTAILSVLALLLVQTFSFAVPADRLSRKERIVKAAKQSVSQASPDDWYTLAKSAKICLEVNKNLSEASQWIDKSLAIHTNPYNLEIKGDYYAKNRLPKKAVDCYIKALKNGHERIPDFDPSRVQKKIAKLINLKIAEKKK
ncbi:hypothetical protein FUAX_28810 [Fulvitalea axinellae]|uniref:Tetratricopeptide repeat protein n=1 Tax=Fulvitalea axinellae TaxID=1182444 RepID=A0AAU9CVC8_9BACT|nr:hypothetical protein FUAX_28810 [Fulvitalea axinellae]